ncbi:MAG TPA: hypothetical protein VNV60_07735 [Holophagaceae bacterium]|nr:hypothetical protein [Holophagaceae bacterium]
MAESRTEGAPEPSIHWRQRWWYALWVALLLGASGFWAWWETPAISGTGHVIARVWIKDLPAGCKVEAWTGPAKAWKQDAPGFQGPWTVQDDATKPLPLPPLEIRAGLRRWHQGYIPRLTSDRLVLRIDPPEGLPRYAAYDLRMDLNAGLAGPHRRLYLSAPLKWKTLSTDASQPSPLLP